MTRIATLLAAAAIGLSGAATAAPGGKLGTLPLGVYVCSLPGDAAGAAWQVLADKDFTIDNASTYHTAEGSGTYLYAGRIVQFTRGPMKGMKFERTGNATLRWIEEDGNAGRVRCVRTIASR